jgi:hypothetical protein
LAVPIKDDQFTPIPTLEQAQRLEALQHQVQSAVAFKLGRKEAFGERCAETEPKFLRVGVNSALVETSALARLMLAKKVITTTEYFETLIQVWQEEVNRYLVELKRIDPRLSL